MLSIGVEVSMELVGTPWCLCLGRGGCEELSGPEQI